MFIFHAGKHRLSYAVETSAEEVFYFSVACKG
jgi:hypothetical protein